MCEKRDRPNVLFLARKFGGKKSSNHQLQLQQQQQLFQQQQQSFQQQQQSFQQQKLNGNGAYVASQKNLAQSKSKLAWFRYLT
jgi:hypothetical protein